MTVPDGLATHLFAAEPMVRQPVAIEFDDRGRLWVVQYLQYPNPAGLSRLKVDRYSRTAYDHVPDPPPKGPRGADRITIIEDTDGDGRADTSKDFLQGLNLASSLAFGHGGIFVLQAPYLLFYADRDRNDVPDGDPEVLLTGFGMEDAHSVANSLTWGPDGWLYGNQGSTVTARIRGTEFQQGIWRYHPPTKRFELFCEGGGNMWGLDFDSRGNLFASTNVGGYVMLHARPGGFYWKAFGKHGPLHNPYTFGYFEHVTHADVRGGHVSVGGLFYEADAFPPSYRGKFFTADLLDHSAHWHSVTPLGSTFQARQEGDLLRANDSWFAPSDMTLGPDGAVYVADWHDSRTAHPDPDADWDRSNGRIYRLAAVGTHTVGRMDLAEESTGNLLALLDHPNAWYVRRALRLLGERRDASAVSALRLAVLESRSLRALRRLWALHASGGFDDVFAEQLLMHPDEEVRTWTVRLLGDTPRPDIERHALAARLLQMARQDPSVRVRAELASLAQRQPRLGLTLAQELLGRDEDADDPHLPFLLWWAVERHARSNEAGIARLVSSPWDSSLLRTTMARLMRRYAVDGGNGCAAMLAARTEPQERRLLLEALEAALAGGPARGMPRDLSDQVIELAAHDPDDALTARLAARFGHAASRASFLRAASDSRTPEATRLAAIDLLADLTDPALVNLAVRDPSARVRLASIRAVGKLENVAIATEVLAAYPRQDDAWRHQARELLLGRAGWARQLLDEVDCGRLAAAEIPIDQVARLALLSDPALDVVVRKHWGHVSAGTPGEKLAEVRRLNNDLRAAPGDPVHGQALFRKHCNSCHRLFGEGAQIGPELTHANRKDRDFLLISLVDPSAVIRREFQSSLVRMRDGRVLAGLVAEQTPSRVTIAVSATERTTVARDEIEEITDSPTSFMPENLYREFSPGALRDLFAYLQGDSSPRAETAR
jgi:putative membrane-bound dehydrogenase-like protein